MANFIKSTAAPITKVVGGNTYTFPMLKRKHIGELLSRWAAEDRAHLLKNLEDSKVEGKDAFEKIEEFDRMSRLVSYGYQCLFEYTRACDVVAYSLKIEHPENDADALIDDLPMTADELVTIACSLWGLNRESLKDQGTDEGADPTQSQTGSSGTPS